jgi:hypothetical protein
LLKTSVCSRRFERLLLEKPNARNGSEAPIRFATSNGCNPSEAVGQSACANDN